MIISSDKTWCMITPPKTASTMLHKLLILEPISASRTQWQHDQTVPVGARVIVSTRNPYTRSVSLYRHWLTSHKQREIEYPFADFMRDILQGNLTEFFNFTQDRWLKFVKRIDAMVRFEYLHKSLAIAIPQYDWEAVEIPRRNDNKIRLTSDPLENEHHREMIREWASRDFARLGYEP